jgi:hypothetical protein
LANEDEAGDESEFAGHTRQVDDAGVLKEATKPAATVSRSDVNTTCMYPVLDEQTTLRPVPCLGTTDSRHEHV